jgi:hypothetical protein
MAMPSFDSSPGVAQRCPVCRARIEAGPQCRRCRADLSVLLALEGQRRRALAAAQRSAAEGRWPEALAIAEGARTLRAGPAAYRLLAVGHLWQRNFARAWEYYLATKRLEAGEQGP